MKLKLMGGLIQYNPPESVKVNVGGLATSDLVQQAGNVFLSHVRFVEALTAQWTMLCLVPSAPLHGR